MADYKVFMRQRTIPLNETNWLRIETRLFNIISVIAVRDRFSEIHHLEVYVEEIMPSNG